MCSLTSFSLVISHMKTMPESYLGNNINGKIFKSEKSSSFTPLPLLVPLKLRKWKIISVLHICRFSDFACFYVCSSIYKSTTRCYSKITFSHTISAIIFYVYLTPPVTVKLTCNSVEPFQKSRENPIVTLIH